MFSFYRVYTIHVLHLQPCAYVMHCILQVCEKREEYFSGEPEINVSGDLVSAAQCFNYVYASRRYHVSLRAIQQRR
jgi:hypothetical protein